MRNLLFIVFITAITSCNDSCDKFPPVNCNKVDSIAVQDLKSASELPTYIVLCDFTSSMDEKSIGFVITMAMEIFDKFYNKAVIQFYPISSRSGRPFFQQEMWAFRDTSHVEEGIIHQMGECIELRKSLFADSLRRQIEMEQKNRSSETYIIQTLENAIAAIKARDPKGVHSNQIFILSDMLEYGNSTLGRINLEDRSFAEDFAAIERLTDTSVLIQPGPDIRIQIGLYTQQTRQQASLIHFWKLVFDKIGYKKEISLSSELDLN